MRRSAVAMGRARTTVTRLLAQGVSHEQAARKAGVAVQTVRLWLRSDFPQNITNTIALRNASEAVPQNITWAEALDAAWDVRRRAGGLVAYRALLRRFSAAFAEVTDPMSNQRDCACQDSDLRRSPCPHDNGSAADFDRAFDAWAARGLAAAA